MDITEYPNRVAVAVRAGGDAAEIHFVCSYPTCNCKGFPRGVKAALQVWENITPALEKK